MNLTMILLAIYFVLRLATLNLGASDPAPEDDEPEGGTHV